MSAGYVIYSLDHVKFLQLVERPTSKQLTTVGKLLREKLKDLDGEFDDGDPILDWPTDAKSLTRVAAERLARPDWYGDLSESGKDLWENVIYRACTECRAIDVGFRVDSDGVYWDVIELAWKHLGVVPKTVTNVAMSAFGARPFRYFPKPKPGPSPEEFYRREPERKAALAALREAMEQFKARPPKCSKKPKARSANEWIEEIAETLQDTEGFSRKMADAFEEFTIMPAFAKFEAIADTFPDGEDGDDPFAEWSPMHSMHPPEEVRRMLPELCSIDKKMRAARDKDVRSEYEKELLPALERVAANGRMLFIHVNT